MTELTDELKAAFIAAAGWQAEPWRLNAEVADGLVAVLAASRERPDTMPKAWADLVEAITLLARGQCDPVSPFNCQHDELAVMADPSAFSPDELSHLDELGFHVSSDTDSFYSFRYGSA